MLKKVSRFSASLVLLTALALTGCVDTHVLPSELPPNGSTTMAVVDASGADLAIADLHVIVPAGAVPAGTAITVHVNEAHVPFTAYSSLLTFEPAGLTLTAPVEIRLPFHGDPSRATAFVAGGNGAYAPQPATIAEDVAVYQMTSLASTFVGTACEGADCSCGAVGMLDLLVVLDNSNSMTEEQALLRAQLPGLFAALAIGDTDGDGVQDAAAFDDVRVGITTTDLGAGPVGSIPTCDTGFGDDGMLLDVPGPAADAMSCTTATYPSAWASYDASTPSGLDGFVAQISCTSSLGTGGCGFEQQLESALLALSPNAPTGYTAPGWTVPMFPEGRVGQGDMANAGFLRDGSVLAILYVTDEDDCSTTDSNLFNPDDPRFASTTLNLRCFVYPEIAIDVHAMAEQLAGLRPTPHDVIVGAITGVPVDVETASLDAVLAAPAMQEMVDASGMTLQPACSSANGVAYPARRIVETLRTVELDGGHAVLGSICAPSFAGFTARLANQLAARAGGSC